MPGQHQGRPVTALTDTLRERISRRGRTALVDCGALGMLTVESLPVKDCSALSESRGSRGLFYAACRELQEAGEILRQEGLVFAPDEIMEYVSDQEAGAAAEAILLLSGTENPAEEDPGHGEAAPPAEHPAEETSASDDGAGGPEAERSQPPGESAVPEGARGSSFPDVPEESAEHRRTPQEDRPPAETPPSPAAPRPSGGAPGDPASEPIRHMPANEPAVKIPGGESPAEPRDKAASGRAERTRRREPDNASLKTKTGAAVKAGTGADMRPLTGGRTPERSGVSAGDAPALPEAERPEPIRDTLPEPSGLPEVPEKAEIPGDFKISGSVQPPSGTLLPEPSRRNTHKAGRENTAAPSAADIPAVGGAAPEISEPDSSAVQTSPGAEPPEPACGISPEAAEQMAWHLLEGLRQAAAVR